MTSKRVNGLLQGAVDTEPEIRSLFWNVFFAMELDYVA